MSLASLGQMLGIAWYEPSNYCTHCVDEVTRLESFDAMRAVQKRRDSSVPDSNMSAGYNPIRTFLGQLGRGK